MTSGKSKKLRNGIIIFAAIFIIVAVVLFVLAGMSTGKANELKEGGYSIFGSVQAQIKNYEMYATLYTVLGVVFLVSGALYAVFMLSVFYRTQITIADDGSVNGTGTVGLKRKAFSANISEIEMPVTNGKNLLGFNIKGLRYSVFTDDAPMFYKKMCELKKK